MMRMPNSRAREEEARKVEMRKMKGKGRKVEVDVTEVTVDDADGTTLQSSARTSAKTSAKRETSQAVKSTLNLHSIMHLWKKQKAAQLPLETAEALYNDNDNPFCNLPALVVDRIAGWTGSNSDIWALSHTCRHLYQALSLSCYEQLCILEENAKLPRHKRTAQGKALRKGLAVCSECRVAHERKCFSVEQLRGESSVRQCWGAEGLFQISEHDTIGFKELQRKVREIGDEWYHVEADSSTVQENSSTHRKFRDTWQKNERNGLVMQKKNGSVEICRAVYLLEGAQGEPFNADEVEKALCAKSHVKLCPHVHASFLQVSSNFREQLCIVNGRHWDFGRIVKRTWWTCHSGECYTRFRIVEQCHEPGRKRLVLDIRRIVGSLEVVTDERWRAQIVSRETVELEQRGW